MYAGIGEMVDDTTLNWMNDFIRDNGQAAFRSAVFHSAFSEVSLAYIHPCDEMRATENFDFIQRAFINAYV